MFQSKKGQKETFCHLMEFIPSYLEASLFPSIMTEVAFVLCKISGTSAVFQNMWKQSLKATVAVTRKNPGNAGHKITWHTCFRSSLRNLISLERSHHPHPP